MPSKNSSSKYILSNTAPTVLLFHLLYVSLVYVFTTFISFFTAIVILDLFATPPPKVSGQASKQTTQRTNRPASSQTKKTANKQSRCCTKCEVKCESGRSNRRSDEGNTYLLVDNRRVKYSRSKEVKEDSLTRKILQPQTLHWQCHT